MTPDIVAELHPPRLPAAFVATGWADLLAAFGLGLVLAALVVALAGPLLRRRMPVPDRRQRIAAAATLPEDERMLALARLLESAGGRLPEDQRAAIYAGQGADPARIERLVIAARGRGR